VPLLTACVFRFSQPPDAFIHPSLTGPVSYQIHSWGFPLQSFTPSVQPYTVSDNDTLLSLAYPGLPSALAPLYSRRIRKCSNNTAGSLKARLQTPSSGFYSTRKSATYLGGLDHCKHTALLGLLPLQGFRPHRNSMTFITPPLMQLQKRCKHHFCPTTGYSFQVRSACLFQDCLPSWGFPPSDPSQLFKLPVARESPHQGPGFITAPLSTLL